MYKTDKICVVTSWLTKSIPNYEAAISFLYLQYLKKYGSKNRDLEGLARTHVNQCIEYRLDKAALVSNFELFQLSEDEYSSVALNLDYKGNISIGRSFCELVDKLLNIKVNDIVLDVGSGNGNFLGYVAKLEKDRFIRPTLFGQEINTISSNTSKMILDMCDANYLIENTDFIAKQNYPAFTKGFVFPPFGLRLRQEAFSPFIAEYPETITGRTSSAWLYLFTALRSLKPNGKIVMIVNENALLSASDANVRKYLIENELLEGIISLPRNSFKGTAVKTGLLVISRGNKSFKVVDGTKLLENVPLGDSLTHEAAIDLYNEYMSRDVVVCSKDDIKGSDWCLSVVSLSSEDFYKGLSDLVRFSDIADVFRGSPGTIKNFKDSLTVLNTGIKLLTPGNLLGESINYDNLPNIVGDKKIEKFFVKKGDLILATKSTRMKIAVVAEEPKEKVVVAGGMLVVRLTSDKINSTYLKIFLESSSGRKILNSIVKGSVVTNITPTDLASIMVSCPNIEIQNKIANQYNKLLIAYNEKEKELDTLGIKLRNFLEDLPNDGH